MIKREHFILFLILIFALGLRIYGLDEHGIWYDEKVSISHALGATHVEDSLVRGGIRKGELKIFQKNRHDISKKLEGIAIDSGGNAIFYDLALFIWIELFGISDFSIRMLSVLISLLSIWLLYELTVHLTKNQNVALISSFLLSISHLSIEYSHEARSYSLGAFLVLLSTFLFYKIFFSERKKPPFFFLVCYTVVNILCFFTHFFTAIALFGQGVYFLARKPKWRTVIQLSFTHLVFFAAIISFYLLLGQESSESLKGANTGWAEYAKDPSYRIDASPKNIFFEYFQVSTHLFGVGLHYLGIRLRYYVYLLVLPLLFILSAWKQANEDKNYDPILLPGIIFLSHLFIMTINSVISSHTIAFVPKYASLISPIVLIPISVGIYHFYLRHKMKWASLILLQFVLFFIPTYVVYTDKNLKVGSGCIRKPNPYIEAMEKINMLQNEHPKTPLVIYTSEMIDIKTLAFYSPNEKTRFELVPDLYREVLVKQNNQEIERISLQACNF